MVGNVIFGFNNGVFMMEKKCTILFCRTKARIFQAFTRRRKIKKSTIRIITEIYSPSLAMTC